MNKPPPPAAAKLLAWRKETMGNISQEKAVALMRKPVSQATWSDWENGNKPPQIGNAIEIERITDGAVPVADWLREEDDEPTPREPAKVRPSRRAAAAGGR